jgi:GntR family transcriptional regulator
MILHLTDQSSEPLQNQIVRQIRALVLSEELPAESDLPSIRQFAREHRVSVITVQRAYEALVREGLIHSRRGKGFFVSELSESQRKTMARQGLEDKLERTLRHALADGLAPEDILQMVRSLTERLSS